MELQLFLTLLATSCLLGFTSCQTSRQPEPATTDWTGTFETTAPPTIDPSLPTTRWPETTTPPSPEPTAYTTDAPTTAYPTTRWPETTTPPSPEPTAYTTDAPTTAYPTTRWPETTMPPSPEPTAYTTAPPTTAYPTTRWPETTMPPSPEPTTAATAPPTTARPTDPTTTKRATTWIPTTPRPTTGWTTIQPATTEPATTEPATTEPATTEPPTPSPTVPSTIPPTPTPTAAPVTLPPVYNSCNCTLDAGGLYGKMDSIVLFEDTDIGYISTEACGNDLYKQCMQHCTKLFRIYTLNFNLKLRPLAPQNSNSTLGQRLCSLVKTKLLPTPASLKSEVTCNRSSSSSTGHLAFRSGVLMKSKQRFSCFNGKPIIY